MTKFTQNFTMHSGDDKLIAASTSGSTSAAKDLTSATIKWRVEVPENVGSGCPITKQTGGSGISITDASAGKFEITLDAADTASMAAGVYEHEAEAFDSSSKTATLFRGTITLLGDIIE